MHNIQKLVFLINLILIGFTSHATHLVGGYFTYKCLGAANATEVDYEITFRQYRDCQNGNPQAPLEDTIPLSIFNSSNVLVRVDTILRKFTNQIPDNINNPCVVQSPDVCVEEGVSTDTIRLLRNAGFLIVFQRCCRNGIIDNITNPGDQGATYTAFIPSFNSVGCNSSPTFNNFPPIVLCSQFDVNLDLSASDADNDSLVYSFCAPLNYPITNGQPLPNPAFAPPYANIPFEFPQTATNPIPSNPQISINSSTGKLTGAPTSIGNYVVGFCVEEYRNGVLLSTTTRDIQINTGNCSPAIINAVQSQEQLCTGLGVNFTNQSFSADLDTLFYFWNFGDLTTLADTSTEEDPFYIYPDSGNYTITLIVNPGFSCADTSYILFRVDSVLNPLLEQNGNYCATQNSVDFSVGGAFSSSATFLWNFDSRASIPSSIQDSVFGVTFPDEGVYSVQLIVSQGNCSDTIVDFIQIYNNPTIDFSFDTTAGCYPFPVQFNNLSIVGGSVEYEWSFGDGNSSQLVNPQNIYTSNGLFDVELTLRTTDMCVDTLSLLIPDAVDVSLDSSKNSVDFDFFPKEGCAPLSVQFSDSSFTEGAAEYAWDFGDGTGSFDQNPINIYSDTGYYSIGLVLFSTTKCIDTLRLTIDSAIRVLPEPIADLVVSDSALPVKQANFVFDGTNSQFADESYFQINGIEVSTDSILNYSFSDTGTYLVDYIVSNQFDCKDTSSAKILVFDEFEFIVPNVFSPNGDGINDRLEVRACGVYEYDISIFDRYGLVVFRSNSMNINWDGRVDGKAVNSGVFFYVITIKDFRGEFINYKGEVTLLTD